MFDIFEHKPLFDSGPTDQYYWRCMFVRKYYVLKWSFTVLGILLVIIGIGTCMGLSMVLHSEGFSWRVALLAIIPIAVMTVGFVTANFKAHDYALRFATKRKERQTVYGTVVQTLPKPRALITVLTVALPDVYDSKATIEKVLACDPSQNYQAGDQIPFTFTIHYGKNGDCLASINNGPEIAAIHG